ncbi:cellulose-growth-specific protein [Coprinellus micaceus]|uniref:AA9 family lytic polysaccharide monooxygenase n=1 Tax=Coprinellus micaceus TaxID=71717 RepID=A0A4Y7TS44_COPMI|nr:cellulose-growth-specific protein [Coprinellus micaceus]
MLGILTSLLIAPFLVNRVAAHGAVTSYRINDEVFPGYNAYDPPDGQVSIARPYYGIDPIFDVLNETIACNNDGGPIGPEGKQLSANIRAGDTITAIYGLWLHPFGPATVYMARCPGACIESNSRDLEWFKINHTGLIDGDIVYGHWGIAIVSTTGEYSAKVPEELAAGEYLIRNELIAIHPPSTGPQHYVECAQLKVFREPGSGPGKLPPSSFLTKFPGAYNPSDPGLNVNLYTPEAPTVTTYQIPGPAVWDGQDEEDELRLAESIRNVSRW